MAAVTMVSSICQSYVQFSHGLSVETASSSTPWLVMTVSSPMKPNFEAVASKGSLINRERRKQPCFSSKGLVLESEWNRRSVGRSSTAELGANADEGSAFDVTDGEPHEMLKQYAARSGDGAVRCFRAGKLFSFTKFGALRLLQSPTIYRKSSRILSRQLGFGNTCFDNSRGSVSRFKALPADRGSFKDGVESGRENLDSEPWLGAVIFKRSAVQNHHEFRTSLERLGMSFLSTESSRNLANAMGLQPESATEDLSETTPVNISVDVSRDEDTRDLRLEGIARTTISLRCNRCLSPVVERIFSSFSLLLTGRKVEEPTQQSLGVVLGGDALSNFGSELDIELDDKLHFPPEAKEIDLSKYIRDSVHLEIPFTSLCSVNCLGLCHNCGVNLNNGTCNCENVNVKSSWGPLEQLRKQMKDEGLR